MTFPLGIKSPKVTRSHVHNTGILREILLMIGGSMACPFSYFWVRCFAYKNRNGSDPRVKLIGMIVLVRWIVSVRIADGYLNTKDIISVVFSVGMIIRS